MGTKYHSFLPGMLGDNASKALRVLPTSPASPAGIVTPSCALLSGLRHSCPTPCPQGDASRESEQVQSSVGGPPSPWQFLECEEPGGGFHQKLSRLLKFLFISQSEENCT